MELIKVAKTGTPPVQRGHILPFDVKKHPIQISQGYNGPWSHTAFLKGEHLIPYDYRFSVDFALPYGTEVIASKAGKVVGYIDDESEWYDGLDYEIGLNTLGNLISLEHDDGLKTMYYHLQKESMRIKDRGRVEQGQVIAQTGRTGWIGQTPHLHFAVYRYEGRETLTYPTHFDNYRGPLEHNELFP